MLPSDRILTGMRPTGPLHLGHFAGALEKWLEFQHVYESFFLIADYQALGDYADDVARIRRSVIDVATDWLAVGLDPAKSHFVIQSYVPEHAELTMLLSMVAPLSYLERNPTLKSEMAQLTQDKHQVTVGFYNYPMSQVADILLPKADVVPVGEDQVPHIEFTRQVARRFNRTYSPTFAEPHALVGRVPRLVGIDGTAKMSKSRNNAIYLKDNPEEVAGKIRRMVTDITGENPRMSPSDPGIVEHNPAFQYLDAFDPQPEEVEDLKARYRAGGVSDKAVKERLTRVINTFLAPIRERREYFCARPDLVRQALISGSEAEGRVAACTLTEVKAAMALTYT